MNKKSIFAGVLLALFTNLNTKIDVEASFTLYQSSHKDIVKQELFDKEELKGRLKEELKKFEDELPYKVASKPEIKEITSNLMEAGSTGIDKVSESFYKLSIWSKTMNGFSTTSTNLYWYTGIDPCVVGLCFIGWQLGMFLGGKYEGFIYKFGIRTGLLSSFVFVQFGYTICGNFYIACEVARSISETIQILEFKSFSGYIISFSIGYAANSYEKCEELRLEQLQKDMKTLSERQAEVDFAEMQKNKMKIKELRS